MPQPPREHTWSDLARALASESPDIVMVLSPDGVVQNVSAAGEAFIGLSAEEVVGRSVIPWIHPDDLDFAIDTHLAAVRGRPRGLATYRVKNGAGEYRWVEVSKQPLRDPQSGKAHAVLEITRDVTERVAVAERLRASEARLRMAQHVGRTGSWWLTVGTDVVTWSAEMARIAGFEPGEEVRDLAAVMALWHEEDRPLVEFMVGRMLEGPEGTEVSYKARLRRSDDGSVRVLACLAARTDTPDGAVLVGVARDVTEEEALREAEAAGRIALERARDAAEEASLAKSRFLANMSHELRTPLNAIIGYAELVTEEAEDLGAAALAPDLARIRTAARHLLGLIDDVLDLSRIEAGDVGLAAGEADPAELARMALADAAPLAAASGNRQDLRLADGLPSFHGDATKLRQCLTNLLGNAHKFTQGGEVTVAVAPETREGATWLRFDVVDTGIGMSATDQVRVFDEFVQAEDGATRRFGGTGLGLTIVRAFARAMGGDVAIESAPGHGTRVSLALPAGTAGPRG